MEKLPKLHQDYHLMLYNKLYLLVQMYNNPKLADGTHLIDHLKRDMFIKANKYAFEQFVYFLLSIVDPDECKKLDWPLFDKKQETQFRKQVKIILSSLNEKYDEARIPVVQTSHMITPGGIKFVKLMFYLAELAVTLVLKNNTGDDSYLLPVLASANQRLTLKRLQKVESVLKLHEKNTFDKFNSNKETTTAMTNFIEQLDEKIKSLTEIESASTDTDSEDGSENADNIQDRLSQTLTELQDFRNSFREMEQNLIAIEKSNEIVYNSTPNLEHIENGSGKINFIEFHRKIDTLLQELHTTLQIDIKVDASDVDLVNGQITSEYNKTKNIFQTVSSQFQALQTKFEYIICKLTAIGEQNSNGINTTCLTPEINLNIPSAAQNLQNIPATTTKRLTILETLTTLKKQYPKKDFKEIKSNVKRNLVLETESNIVHPEPVININIPNSQVSIEHPQIFIETPIQEQLNLSFTSPAMTLPDFSSTPENPFNFNTDDKRKLIDESECDISVGILDLKDVDDELNSSILFKI